jgi:MFS family permease
VAAVFAAVLGVPGSARLFVASLLARTPVAALGLIFVLRTKELTGSFAAGGLASGVLALASAACSPALGRLVDRRGQTLVLGASATVCAVACVAFAALSPAAPLGAVLACALVAGAAMPPLGPCLRALWPRLIRDPDALHAAFALDASAVELTFVVGPVVLAAGLGAWSTAAAAIVSGVLLLAGTLAFAATPQSRAWRTAERAVGTGRAGALRGAGVRTLIAVFVLIGTTFGAVEVGVPAATAAAGVPRLAGLVLGVWAAGSMLGGLLAARAGPPHDPIRRLCLLLATLAGGHLLVAVPDDPWVIAALLLAAGCAIAPMFTLAYGMVEALAPAGTVTEAYTWLSTGIAAGFAAGSAAGGFVAEAVGPGAAFAVAAVACAGAAATGALRRRTLVSARPLAVAAAPG